MSYIERIEAAPQSDRWAMARGFLFNEPLPFYAELRERRPVFQLPEVTLVSRFADCSLILRRHQVFGVDLYGPKQGGYFMSQDDTAAHWREKSVMKSILDVEDIPKIRAWVGETADGILVNARGDVELVRHLTRGVPVRLVQDWFGFRGSDPEKLITWSYWNQQDAFWNQPFDSVAEGIDQEAIIKNRERHNIMMALYLGRLVLKRKIAVSLGSGATDSVSRLLRLSSSDGVDFDIRNVVTNVGGLLIGAVETTSHAVVNALNYLRRDPDLLRAAQSAAQSDDPSGFDGFVFEALRFRPAFPYFFRVCHRHTVLSADTDHQTDISPGTTVLAVTHSAMFDPTTFPDPDSFDAGRDFSDTFTFGQGIHSCLGRHIAGVMVPEITRQILRRRDLGFGNGPDFDGTRVPQKWVVTYAT